MAVVTPYQATFNGLTLGVGGDASFLDLEGLRGLPAIRSGDIAKSRQDGDFAGLNFLDERIFTIDLLAFNPAVGFETVLAEVAAAFQNISDPAQQLPFEFLMPGWANSRFVTCRPTKGGVPIDLNYQYFDSTIPIELTAADPLVYSTVLKTSSGGLPSPTAGLTFNATPNFVFGASTGGSLSVTNSGNYITAPIITIAGPVTNPTVTFTATGAFIKLNITLGPTDVIVIDMGARTVVLNGTAFRLNTIVTGSSWWGIPSGTWSIGLSSSDATAVTALFTVTWRDTWGWV